MSETVLNHDGGYWRASKTYLICMIEGVQTPMKIENQTQNAARRKPGIHAEKILIDELTSKGYRGTITLYINNSPCCDCAMSLKKFVNDNTIRLTLYVTNLFYITRSSCLKRKEPHWISTDLSDPAYCGLRYLMKPGPGYCTIEAFTEQVWSSLMDALDLEEREKTRFIEKYGQKRKGNDRSRKTEDIRIKKDLNYIKTYSLSKYKKKHKLN